MDTGADIFDKHRSDLERIEAELRKCLDSHVPLVREIGVHTLLAKGKRLRPLLFVLCSRACGYAGEDAYRLSTVFEYIHAASLLHDDVLDSAELRRNRPSANQVWGNHAAVLEGDYLYSKCVSIAVSSRSLAFLDQLAAATLRMTEGQILEFAHTDDWAVSSRVYLDVITAKTAALVSASCACGAILAGKAGEAEQAFSRFGMNMGVAFQMTDDLLDYTAQEQSLGKPVGKDLREGKVTLPLIYTLPRIEDGERKRLEERLRGRKATEADYARVMELVRSNGALDRIRRETRTYAEEAEAFLDPIPASQAKSDLLDLNRYILYRAY
jgi:octaprenyl-diphosphate synthase